jgi:signal transduction histidine kinase
LIDNAVKFTAEGSIRLTARLTPDDQCVEITVEDTGVGMDAEEIQRVLKGIEVAPSDQREYRGLGLGLRMATRMTNFLGGRLSVQSTPGSGTRLAVQLPRRFRDAPANNRLM